MSLISINDTSKAGNFDLLASQSTALPGLTNNSDKSITVEITASGQWSLLSPDFATSDPSLTPYKVAVDADGYPTPEKESEYILKYPKLNPGVLVGEIKNAQGETKHLVSGKKQRFELQPNETVSFGINDSPQYFGDNFGKVTIAYSIVPKVEPNKESQPIIDLYNTGVDNSRNALGDSVVDPHYTLTSSPSGTVTPAVTTPSTSIAKTWVANSTTSRWIGPNTASAVGPIGEYTYKTTFTLPSFSAASIVGTLSVDDQIIDILINGVSAGNSVPFGSWTAVSKFSISSGFVVGLNTIEFKLNTIGGPTGLRVDSITGTYTPSLLKATIYQHGDFQGISKEVGIGSYGVSELGFPNDALSSLKVPKGLKVTLYEHGIDLGRSKVFTADAGWVGDDFNDVTSAIKVELFTAPVLSTGVKIKLKSWKGDYLHRPDTDQGVTTWHTGVGNEWTVEAIADNKIKLKSWKGDYLHRPDTEQGVTSWHTGVGNEWTVEAIADNKIKLKSWKGDYLHRPDSQQGVTTWSTGVGNEWEFEVIS
jgi:hypothetical protein